MGILLRVIKETTCALLFWGGEKKIHCEKS